MYFHSNILINVKSLKLSIEEKKYSPKILNRLKVSETSPKYRINRNNQNAYLRWSCFSFTRRPQSYANNLSWLRGKN